MRRPQARPCFVYIIHRPDTQEVKIGIAADVDRRFRQLQQANGGDLFLLASVAGGSVDEAFAHSRWQALHKRGEWFTATPELLEWAEGIAKGTLRIQPVAADSLTDDHNYTAPPSVYDAAVGRMPRAFWCARWAL